MQLYFLHEIFSFIQQPSCFREPKTIFTKSDCFITSPVFSKYWTGHCPERSRKITFVDFLVFYGLSFLKNFLSHRESFTFFVQLSFPSVWFNFRRNVERCCYNPIMAFLKRFFFLNNTV